MTSIRLFVLGACLYTMLASSFFLQSCFVFLMFFRVFKMFLVGLATVVRLCFMCDIVLLIDWLYCIDLFSCIAASLFNKLTLLYFKSAGVIGLPRRYTRRKTVTHSSTNRARCRVTSLIRPIRLPSRYPTNTAKHGDFYAVVVCMSVRPSAGIVSKRRDG